MLEEKGLKGMAYQGKMLQYAKPPFLVEGYCLVDKDHETWHFNLEGVMDLKTYFEGRFWTDDLARLFLMSFKGMLESLEVYLLDEEGVALSSKRIYLDPNEEKCLFLYHPSKRFELDKRGERWLIMLQELNNYAHHKSELWEEAYHRLAYCLTDPCASQEDYRKLIEAILHESSL